MSTPTVDTDGAAGICIHISETGTYLGASSDGASQASNTTSHAQEHRVKLEAKMSEYGKIIAQLPTNNAPVVGLGLASSTVPDSASHPKGLGETHTASTVISAPTVTISSDNTDNADTQPTSMDEDDAFGDSKSEGSATDRACYGADSDSSNHFESSDRSSSGSPDPATTTHKLSGLAEWVKPGPGEEKESGTVSQQPHIEYPKDILIEPQGPTTASQSGTPKTANHAQKRKNATSQDKASQPQVLPRGEQSVTSAFQSSLPGTANLSRERRNASLYEEPHELQSVRTHLKASPHAEPAPASSYTVDLEAANPNAIGHNGVPPASPSQDNAEVQNEPGRDSPVVKLFKRIITVVGLVAALVFGIVACINKLDLLLACTIVIMIAGVDSMIQDF